MVSPRGRKLVRVQAWSLRWGSELDREPEAASERCCWYPYWYPAMDSPGSCRTQVPDFSGGASRDRTGDLLHAMQALSQLSYGPTGGRRRYVSRVRLSRTSDAQRPPAG